MNTIDIEKWFRQEIMNDPATYPNLFKTEIAKNRYNFTKG